MEKAMCSGFVVGGFVATSMDVKIIVEYGMLGKGMRYKTACQENTKVVLLLYGMNVDQNFYHVTWVTHNSRVSERMFDVLHRNFIKGMVPIILNYSDQLRVANLIGECSLKYSLPIITFNVLPDHIHMLGIVSDENELSSKIGKMKGYIAHILRNEKSIKSRVWARKFNSISIEDDIQLQKVINYINNNHLKHESSWGRNQICGFGEELISIREKICINIDGL